jgi:hypothetical protein
MANTQDELCPDYVGEKRIVLNRADPTSTLRARTPITLTVNYDACDPQGVVLPLVLTIATERGSSFDRQVFRRSAPSEVTFVPREGGPHTVRLAEFAHNRWFGTLTLDVLGDRLRSEA